MSRLRVLATAFLALAPLAGAAQEYGLTDQQRRRLHLPYVRAATDCLARAIAVDIPALDNARNGQWYEALIAVQGICRPVLVDMVREHDRLYGPGTGDVFFKGPYVADLPRALLGRLKAAIEQRAQGLARLEDERRQRAAAAQKVQELLRDRLYDCTTKQLIGLVSSAEPAEVLADAALTICSQELDQAVHAGIELVKAGETAVADTTLQIMEKEMRVTARREVMTNAVQVRAAANASSQKPRENTALEQAPVTSAPMQSPEDCLKAAGTIREGKLVDQEKLVSMMLDLCRPEIENAARSAFLSDSRTSLDEARRSAAAEALASAKRIVGAQ
ncbi:hypothetical protein ACETIH_23440 [Microvirga arabica]|uniref:Uncharacterized protein n=1 Tax=Microvirga arabica TaxID=1128671 RepID=A0ABV6YE79_9HYPH